VTRPAPAEWAKAICYVSAGTRENWRPDASQSPASVKSAKNGWPGERWLDIRQMSIPIMDARVAKCRQAGFGGVEWDSVDGYSSNRSRFPLTCADQLAYINCWLTVKVAPCGSARTAALNPGLSYGGTMTVPPRPAVRSAMSSASSQ
jgi:hypothetical protein